MKAILVVATALLLLSVTAPGVAAGPNCPAVQPWYGVCNAVVRTLDRAEDTAEDLQDQIPPVP